MLALKRRIMLWITGSCTAADSDGTHAAPPATAAATGRGEPAARAHILHPAKPSRRNPHALSPTLRSAAAMLGAPPQGQAAAAMAP
eukprot:COSAG01_NODE_5859_length_3987_cov_80.637088_4_plen_86_part_00